VLRGDIVAITDVEVGGVVGVPPATQPKYPEFERVSVRKNVYVPDVDLWNIINVVGVMLSLFTTLNVPSLLIITGYPSTAI